MLLCKNSRKSHERYTTKHFALIKKLQNIIKQICKTFEAMIGEDKIPPAPVQEAPSVVVNVVAPAPVPVTFILYYGAPVHVQVIL